MLIAGGCDRRPIDKLHDEIRPSLAGLARIVEPGDIGVFHQCEGLALCLESAQDGCRIEAGFEHLERYFAVHGILLLREVDNTHSALTNLANDCIRTERVIRPGLGARLESSLEKTVRTHRAGAFELREEGAALKTLSQAFARDRKSTKSHYRR